MSHPTAITIPVQLDGHNYREWAFCVETVLGGYGLVSHLTGTKPVAAADGSNASILMLVQSLLGLMMMAGSRLQSSQVLNHH